MTKVTSNLYFSSPSKSTVSEYNVCGHTWTYHDSWRSFVVRHQWHAHTMLKGPHILLQRPSHISFGIHYHFILDLGTVAISNDLGRMQTEKKDVPLQHPQLPLYHHLVTLGTNSLWGPGSHSITFLMLKEILERRWKEQSEYKAQSLGKTGFCWLHYKCCWSLTY